MGSPLKKLTLGRVLWRSFLIQATWNYQGQQNLGLASAMFPAIEEIYGPGTDQTKDTMIRYLEPFNTQPYMAGPIIGAMIQMEMSGQRHALGDERFDRFRAAAAAAFAAIGDGFFWNAMLPLAAVVAMFWAIYGQMAATLIFLVFYNIPHLAIRVGGFWLGCLRGFEVTQALSRLCLPQAALILRLVCSGILGALAVWSQAVNLGSVGLLTSLVIGVTVGPMIMLLSWSLKKPWPIEFFIYGLLAVLLILAYILD